MPKTLMGAETEFGFATFARNGSTLEQEHWLARLIGVVRESRPHLVGMSDCDVWLGSGARLYVDCGHPEWATPEVTSPRECVRYLRAGESILSEAAMELERRWPDSVQAILFKNNVDYGSSATWGAHENYLFRSGFGNLLPDLMIPHLVTRIVYTGPGGLRPDSPGIEFSLSPRAWRLQSSVSLRHSIFNTRDEPLARDYQRLHVVAGESLCSQLAEFLRLGTTALVLALYDSGAWPRLREQLSDPLRAMREFAADPSCSARNETPLGNPVTALEVQRKYLQRVEAHLDSTSMPAWAEEVCIVWRDVLGELERDPTALETKLDWPLKLAIFKQRARQLGIAWESVGHWTRAQELSHASNDRKPIPERVDGMEQRLRAVGCSDETTGTLVEQMRARGMSPAELWKSYHALRRELQELDIRFSQLGTRGVFAQLDREGLLKHRVVADDAIAAATKDPPVDTRARVRGEQIRALAAQRRHANCDWTRILDAGRDRILHLPDPFADSAPRWRPIDARLDLMELAEVSSLSRLLWRRGGGT